MCGGGAAGVNRDPPHATGFHQLRGATLPFVCDSPDRQKSARAWRYGNQQIAQDRHKAALLALRKSEYEEQGEEAEVSPAMRRWPIERERARRESVCDRSERQRGRERNTQRRERQREIQTERERERERQTDRQTETDTHTHTHREGFSFVDCQ
jgi:hypothetical protein